MTGYANNQKPKSSKNWFNTLKLSKLATCGVYELVRAEDYLEIGGVKYEDCKEELLRIEPADFRS